MVTLFLSRMHRNHLNRQILRAKNVLLGNFCSAPPPPPPPIGLKMWGRHVLLNFLLVFINANSIKEGFHSPRAHKKPTRFDSPVLNPGSAPGVAYRITAAFIMVFSSRSD